jgi:hypothetical protein
VTVSQDTGDKASAVFSLPLAEKDAIEVGMNVVFGTYTAEVESIYQDDKNVYANVKLDAGQNTPAAGTYDGKVIIERVTPISFLLN